MSTRSTSAVAKILLFVALLLAPILLSQTPAKPGILQIDSNPDQANIFVNGKSMNQLTPATLVVSPGTYAVSVTGKSGNPRCPTTPSFQVSSGQTVERYCTGTTWGVKPE